MTDESDQQSTIDELMRLTVSTANFLRGMSIDPQVPAHAREAIEHRVQELDALTSKLID